MKHLPILLAFFSIALSWCLSCQPIEFDEEDKGGKETVIDTTAGLTVATLGAVEIGSYVNLKAYIVGYCATTGKSGFTLGLPTTKEVRTNILIADSPDVTSVSLCAPCQLEANTDVRDDLNLTDNPQNLGKPILLYGKVQKYFGVMGFKPVVDYDWVDPDETPSTPEKPEENSKTITVDIITDQPAEVFEGC